MLGGHRGARLSAQADGTQIDRPQALLVANNPYGTGDIAGLGRRARLDRGILGVVGVTVSSAGQAVGLLRGRHAAGLKVLTTKQITITADTPQIPVGVDGESIDVHAGDLHDLPRRTARLGATGPSGRPRAEAAGELGQPAPSRGYPP